jgi:hypothetical protein
MSYHAMTLCRAKCPTCQDVREGQCCSCRRLGHVEVMADPYASEIEHDDTKHALCEDCCEASAADI